MVMDALIVLNFKAYKQATGATALKLAGICDKVAADTGAKVVVAPQVADLHAIASEVSIPVYGQHVDNIGFGSGTGWTVPESIKDAGASGCLLNHSEHRLQLADIEALVGRLRGMGLTSIVCTNNIKTTQAAALFGPDYVAVEPPELIGSGIPVSQAQPDIVTGSVDAVKKANSAVEVLCGAGITKGEDLRKAIELGTKGVLLASGIIKADDQEKALRDLIKGLE